MEILPLRADPPSNDEGEKSSEWMEEERDDDGPDCCEACDDTDCSACCPAWLAAINPLARLVLFVFGMLIFILILIFTNISNNSANTIDLHDIASGTPRKGINASRAHEILTSLCDAYRDGFVSGDSCNRLCFTRKWLITDYYEGHKVVIVMKDGGQTAAYKSERPFYTDFPQIDTSKSYEQYSDMVLDKINDELRLGWPVHYKRKLMEMLWPTLLRSAGEGMAQRDRVSLSALIQQPEFILFRLLPLTRVTPKIIGSCGHMYEVESLVAFRMKSYYMNLKGKILIHLMGTLKLLYEFLNEPLQWCAVNFENLGLSADYPKRFVLMDGDMVYTQSKLNSMLKGKPCVTDADCKIGDCEARCTADLTCSERSNENLEVFCDKLINKLFGTNWSRNNKYLLACHDTGSNITKRLNDLRLTWSWNLSDV